MDLTQKRYRYNTSSIPINAVCSVWFTHQVRLLVYLYDSLSTPSVVCVDTSSTTIRRDTVSGFPINTRILVHLRILQNHFIFIPIVHSLPWCVHINIFFKKTYFFILKFSMDIALAINANRYIAPILEIASTQR